MACRSACKTQDHESYGACCRSANVGVSIDGKPSVANHQGAVLERELTAYQKARKQGIQPASTRMRDIKEAVTLSQVADRPYDAATRGFKQ